MVDALRPTAGSDGRPTARRDLERVGKPGNSFVDDSVGMLGSLRIERGDSALGGVCGDGGNPEFGGGVGRGGLVLTVPERLRVRIGGGVGAAGKDREGVVPSDPSDATGDWVGGVGRRRGDSGCGEGLSILRDASERICSTSRSSGIDGISKN